MKPKFLLTTIPIFTVIMLCTSMAAEPQSDVQKLLDTAIKYFDGVGVEQDYQEAAKYFRQAAELGDARAQHRLAMILANVDHNNVEARKWFLKSAEQNYAEAEYELGLILVDEDPAKARAWFLKAAQQNLSDAQINLALMELEGKGGQKDVTDGLQRLEQAASMGASYAMRNLAAVYMNGDCVPQNFLKSQDWALKAAQKELDHQASFLSIYFVPSRETPSILQDFKDWLEAQAKAGQVDSQFLLGTLYEGLDGSENYEKAAHWYQMANNAHAQLHLGSLYQSGKLTAGEIEQDMKTAGQWYAKAAEQGLGEAQYRLGQFYQNGNGVEQDPVQAFQWLSLATDQGVSEAKAALDVLHAEMSAEQLEQADKALTLWKTNHSH